MPSLSVRRFIINTLLVVAGSSLWAGLPVQAQQRAESPGQVAAAAASTATAGKTATTVPANSLQPLMSEAEMSEADAAPAEATLATASAAGYAAMGPGVCSVVEEVIRQFCATNPGDISCQFQ